MPGHVMGELQPLGVVLYIVNTFAMGTIEVRGPQNLGHVICITYTRY